MTARRSQQGTTSAEFAVIGLVLFTVIFALIDLSRLYWNMAALDEATRRGARVAAVCPVNDPFVAQTALFDGLIPSLGTQHISVEYLDEDGVAVADPAAANYGDILYVRVSIQDFQLQTFIPGLQTVITMPAFETTIPRESLGRIGTADVNC
jgi:hypothetical protein